MKIKEVVNISELDFIIRAQVAMAKETENLDLDKSVVTKGVHNLFDQPKYGKYYIALVDDQIIASLLTTYEWSDWRNGICLWIQSVYVLPEHRGNGVYRSMYNYLKEIVEQNKDYTGLRLYVDKTNLNAQKVYEKCGMSKEHYELYEWLK